jgi:tetratricopeptide (TPR) repeat protein
MLPHSVHLDRDLLRGVHRGELPVELLSQIGLRHLLDVCPHCRREVQAFQQEVSVKGENLSGVLHDVLRRHLAGLRKSHRAAEQDLKELLALPEAERFAKISRSRRRFRGEHLVRLLLDECEERFTTSPAESRHFAELARAVIQYSPIRTGAFGLMALAVADHANACRVCGSRRESDEHFAHVRYLVNHYAVTDAETLARIADLEASLRTDQRRFPEAEALLRRALTLYRLAGASRDIGRVLVKLGNVFYAQGLPYKAIEAIEEALRLLQTEPRSQLYLMGRYNLTLFLAETGRPEQAAAFLAADADLYKEFPGPWTQLRLLGLQAQIAAGLGDLDRAIALFAEAREGFIREGIGYDAAVVSLEMAGLYRHQGKTAEVKALAEGMVIIFEAQDVHREAIAALMLFQEAVRAETVTDTLLDELRAYFLKAKHDPSYRFKPSKG